MVDRAYEGGYSISPDRTAENTHRHLRKNPMVLEGIHTLLQEQKPLIVVRRRFAGHKPDDAVDVFVRQFRWTILIDPEFRDPNLAKWFGAVVVHLREACNYRPILGMRMVREVIWEEARTWAAQYWYEDIAADDVGGELILTG